jgi:oligopeptide transport system permease protein
MTKQMPIIDKNKLVFVQKNQVLHDEALKTKPIGYYKDAWNRFKKNKASYVAMFFILFIMFFTIVGPFLKVYDLPSVSAIEANRLRELPPRVPLLENIGIFDGSKRINGRSLSYLESLPEGVLIEVVREFEVQGVILADAIVDYYKFLDYDNSTIERARNLNELQYQQALDRNAVINLISIDNGVYRTQLDFFRYSLDQNAEDTYFWFGTDLQGRDLFTLLWQGSRISIFLAITVTSINLIIGLFLGSIAGYYGGLYDLLFDRLIDILSNIPFLAILTLLVLRFGSTYWIVIVAFVATGWIGSYGATRAQFYRYKLREYVLAARTLGAKDGRIMSKHIFPNAIGTLITSFSLAIPSFIFTESTFSFLGIINYSNGTSIGRLLSIGQATMQQHYHLIMFPAIYLSILMLSFNLFANGLRDAFNPSLRGVDE